MSLNDPTRKRLRAPDLVAGRMPTLATCHTPPHGRPLIVNERTLERRKCGRVGLNRSALIGIGRGHAVSHCIVRDVSASGAQLSIALKLGVPDEFVLLISTNRPVWRGCQVVRRSQREIAVGFVV